MFSKVNRCLVSVLLMLAYVCGLNDSLLYVSGDGVFCSSDIYILTRAMELFCLSKILFIFLASFGMVLLLTV